MILDRSPVANVIPIYNQGPISGDHLHCSIYRWHTFLARAASAVYDEDQATGIPVLKIKNSSLQGPKIPENSHYQKQYKSICIFEYINWTCIGVLCLLEDAYRLRCMFIVNNWT